MALKRGDVLLGLSPAVKEYLRGHITVETKFGDCGGAVA